ncbi:hypothetical protein ACWC9U_28690 [Streptomyces sp. 900116325]
MASFQRDYSCDLQIHHQFGPTAAVSTGRPRSTIRPHAGYLWIPTKPGLTRAAVRTVHAAQRSLVMQVFGAPLRSGALLLSRP